MNGNAKFFGPGEWANFHGKVCQNLWPAFKQSVEQGKFNFRRYSSNSAVVAALRRGFLPQSRCLPDLGLDIGKVTKKEVAGLSVEDLVRLQEFFYEWVHGLYVRFPDELVPEASNEFAWPVCMLGNLMAEDAFNGGTLNPPRWKWTDQLLDAELDLSRGRDAWRRSYIALVRPNWEADEDMKNICGYDADAKNLNVLMLRERLVLGNFLFWLTGQHLDRETVTLTGSRWSGGDVAHVYFHPHGGWMHVGRVVPSHSDAHWRFRQSVSLPPKAD